MLKLIRGGRVFAPEALGYKDILIAGEKILKIADHIEAPAGLETKVIEADGMNVIPGIIDGHVHILGAGGGAGPNSRSTLLCLSSIARAGVTTLVGTLGIDCFCFTLKEMLVRARSLETEGLTTYMLSGSYTLPAATILSNVLDDLYYIDKVIGVKIALNEALSSHPSKDQMKELISKVWLGGKLGGKAGVLVAHLGNAPGTLQDIVDLLCEMDIPREMFVATHVNRSPRVLDYSIESGKQGLSLDLTGCIREEEMIPASKALRILLDKGVPLKNITFSSDSNAAYAFRGEKGINRINVCAKELKDMVEKEGFSLSDALKPLTINPAVRYQIEAAKGSIEEGKDADIVFLDDELQVDSVFSRGKMLVKGGFPVIRGRLEEPLLEILG